jgi:SHS2 domain-containing protein
MKFSFSRQGQTLRQRTLPDPRRRMWRELVGQRLEKPEAGVVERPSVGHRSVPHTADVRIEAWAPSRERCVAEAIAATVTSFAEVSDARPEETVGFRVEPGADEDMLVAALDEVIYRMDTAGQLPVDADVAAVDGGFDVRLRMIGTDRVELVGAVPKAVSLHELRFGPSAAGWSCSVTLDV